MGKLSCPNCGTPIERDDAFCSECGEKLDIIPEKVTSFQMEKGNPMYEKASGAFWNNLFTGLMKLLLVPWLLLLLYSFVMICDYDSDGYAFATVAVIGFIVTLFFISGSMVFGSLAKNIEKIANQMLILQKTQEEQTVILNEIRQNITKGE